MPIVYDQIGAEVFLTLEGSMPQPQATELEEITRPGVRGRAFRQQEQRGAIWRVRTVVDLLGSAAAVSKVSDYKAMVGTVVTVKYRGENFATYMVIDVMADDIRVVTTPVGGVTGGTHLVEASWVLAYAGT